QSIMMNLKYVSTLVLIVLALSTMIATAKNNELTPMSIKLALTQDVTQMRITWNTRAHGSSPLVLYDTQPFNTSNFVRLPQLEANTEHIYQALGGGWNEYVNTALLTGLTASTTYYYSVGEKDELFFSDVFNFTTAATDFNADVTPFSIVVYGDMGIWGGSQQNIQRITERVDDFSFAFHLGDIAYADLTSGSKDLGNETVWNEFLDMVNPITSHIPYMVCPGNHDIFLVDFDIYRHTFQMPCPVSDAWYSFDYNGIHFLSYSTEHLVTDLSPQHNWIENDLKNYRKKNPDGWVVVIGHRPFYCSTVWDYCNKDTYKGMSMIDSLEHVFYMYNVDLYITGHAHAYERTLPMLKGKAEYGTYDAPRATVHMVIGTGGNQEGPDGGWDEPAPAWSVGERLLDTGYGIFDFTNSTHLHYSFVNATTNEVRDEFWLTKGNW
ncbi:hypothetical protein SAMD00019534_057970, partial [Acytostelium subglobosum LB1]|uniref:hypothetical protein n=1 Tax=Acytostelium subglobosum LB1 TaxID=1410327 RepID=UPI000644A964